LLALDWVARKAWLRGRGLFLDLYDPAAKAFIERGYLVEGRPLLDDAVFLTGHECSGNPVFRDIAVETADQLLRDEGPPGNWIKHPPCLPHLDRIHPRQAYWWGRPMLAMFHGTGDRRYLECFTRSVRWYVGALRTDGGLFRNTRSDFNTESFGHATSGVACAALMFLDHHEETGDGSVTEPLVRGLRYGLNMQFTRPADPNLKGCILEKVRPPNGTDASPYYLRDLGTIFFIQALSRYLACEPRPGAVL
jgi:hypothetical protein